MRVTTTDKARPAGIIAAAASRDLRNQLTAESTTAVRLPKKWTQPAVWARARETVAKSMKPNTAASRAVTTPAATSQSEARAQNASPVRQKARSLSSTPTRKPMGSGTSIGWSGCPAMAAVLGAPVAYWPCSWLRRLSMSIRLLQRLLLLHNGVNRQGKVVPLPRVARVPERGSRTGRCTDCSPDDVNDRLGATAARYPPGSVTVTCN